MIETQIESVAMDSWTYEQKQDVFKTLLKSLVGAQPIADGVEGYAALPLTLDDVHPGCHAAVSVSPHVRFKAQRLVIFEHRSERIDREHVNEFENETSIVGPWWKRKAESIYRLRESRTIEHTIVDIVPRSVWTVSNVFVGHKPQLLNSAPLDGSLFGHDTKVTLYGDICEKDLMISAQVKNASAVKQSFSGVILGKIVDDSASEEVL